LGARWVTVLAGLAAAIVAALTLAVPLAASATTPAAVPTGTMSPRPGGSVSPAPSPSSTSGGWCGGGIWNGSGAWGGTGMWGTGFGRVWLEDHPQAFQAWLDLMAAHRTDMRGWYQTYRDDLRGDAAQQALHDLWQSFWNDMKSFYQQYANGAIWTAPGLDMWGGWMTGGGMGGGMMGGWDPSHMWGTGYGVGWLTRHPGAMGVWLHLHRVQQAAIAGWWKGNSSNPTSTAAQTALTVMRQHHRAQVRTFLRHHHLRATTARMLFGAGGWMGLGGMWGGWGW